MKIKAHTFFMFMFFFLILPLVLIGGEDKKEEDSPYLWTYELGDSNVDLFWDGYWKFHFSTGLALEFEKGVLQDQAVFPGFTTGFRFLQTPDLLLSLWLDDRYFFEASVVEDYDKNTYLLGYQGKDDEYLQSVRVGNSSLLTDSYAGLNVTAPAFNTPGFSLKGTTRFMQNELMLRLDGTWEDRRFFIGSYEAQEEYIELFQYERVRQFILPDKSVTNLKVYLENNQGSYQAAVSVYKYDLAVEGDYLYDSEKGLLSLVKNHSGRIAVYYESGGFTIGDNSLGAGAIVPPTKAGSGIPDVKGTLLPFSWTTADPYVPGDNYDQTRQEVIAGQDCLLIHEPDRFSPFASYSIYPYQQSPSADEWLNEIHLTEDMGTEQKEPDSLSWSFNRASKELTLYRSGEDSRSALYRYPLGDVVPQVYGNAPVKDSALIPYQLQYLVKRSQEGYRLGTGVVAGSVEIRVNGRPEYNYSLDKKTGAITFRRYIFPQDRIEISYRRESLDFQGQEMLIYQGNRFILSPRDTLEQATSFNWVFPDGEDSSTPDGGTLQTGLSWEHRGVSFKLKTTVQGELDLGDADGVERIMGMETALMAYPLFTEALAEPAPDSSYTIGNYVPPSQNLTALDPPAGTPFDSPIVSVGVPLFGLNEWTGVDVKLSNKGTVDYSHLEALRFYVRDNTGDSSVVRVILGETGEKTDWDGNGIIDPSQEYLSISYPYTVVSGNWEPVEILLTDSDRQKLTRCRSLKFIFNDADGWNTARNVQLGGIEFIGQTFTTEVFNNLNSASMTITEETDHTLAMSYSSEINQFHKSGEEQRIKHFKWETDVLDPSEYWEATRWMDDKSLTRFGKIIFFVKTDDGSNNGTTSDYSLDLSNLEDRGIHLSWTSQAAVSDWQKVTIDLAERQAYFEKGADNISIIIDGDMDDLNKIILKGFPVSTSESLYLDEIYFDQSIMNLGGKGEISLEYGAQEILTGAGGFQWIGDLSLSAYTSGALYQQLGGLAQSGRNLFFQSVLEMEMLYTGIEINLDGTLADEQFSLWGGHRIIFPAGPSFLTVTDSFALGDGESRPSFSHESTMKLNPVPAVTGSFSHRSSQINQMLTQNWSGAGEFSHNNFRIGGTITGAGISREPLRGLAFDDSPYPSDYGSVWLDSWTYAIPDRTDIVSRNLSEELSFIIQKEPIGLNLNVSAGSHTGYAPLWSQSNRYASQLAIPLKLGPDIVLTPRYSRSLSRTINVDYSDSFAMDFKNWAEEMMPIFPLTSYIPFREIWGDEPVNEKAPDLGDFIYKPSFSIAMDRRYGSRLMDLFVPSLVEAAFSKTYVSKSSSFYYENLWEFTLRQRALNLFGQFGVYPLFDFYTTEEIANGLNLIFTAKNALLPQIKTLSWNSYQRFEGSGGGRFSLENDLSWNFQAQTVQERLKSSYHWQLGRQPYRKIPLSDLILDKESYVTHDENLEYSLTNSQKTDITHIVSGSHFSTLHIDNLGTLKGWIKLGCQLQETSALYGTEFGMELTLTF